jgi:probable rRNA maturation factor
MILIEPTIQDKFGRALRRRALSAFLRDAAPAAGLTGEVSVLLTGDRRIRRLNQRFRGKDKATDVLSFPVPPFSPGENLDGADAIAGDLAISVETAARQAKELGHPVAMELRILVLHGLLHLAGCDHETDRGQMARKEAALRRRFALPAGLIERNGHGVQRPERRAQGPAGGGQHDSPMVAQRKRSDKGRSPGDKRPTAGLPPTRRRRP